MSSKAIQPLIVMILALFMAFMVGNLVVDGRYQIIFLFLAGAIFVILGVTAKTEHLIYLTFAVLLAGNSAKGVLRGFAFYLRFGAMTLFLLRLIPMAIRERGEAVKGMGRFPVSVFHFAIIAYVSLGLLSAIYSLDHMLTFQRAVALSILFGAVFVYLYWVANSVEEMKHMVKVMVKAAIAVLVVGFILFRFLGLDYAYRGGRLRLFLFSPNQLGYICAILFPAVFWYYSEAKGLWTKIYSGVGCVLFVVAMVMTASRGSLVCLALSGLLLVALAYRKKLVFYVLVIFVATSIIYIFFPPDPDRFIGTVEERIVRSESLETGSGRLPIWKQAWHLSQQKPYFGYGLGTVNVLFERGYFMGVTSEFQGITLHNSYLEILLDLGFAGIFLFLWSLALVTFKSVHVIKSTWGTEQQRFTSMLFCCFFSGATSALFETWLTSPGNLLSFPFWFCVALLLRLGMMNRYDLIGEGNERKRCLETKELQ